MTIDKYTKFILTIMRGLIIILEHYFSFFFLNYIFTIKNKSIFTHVKLNIFPDGGVARLRIYGEILVNKVFFGKKVYLNIL